MVLPTTIEGQRGKEIAPDVWLITDPTYYSQVNQWRALANVSGCLCVVQLRVYIDMGDLELKG
jgi:hypothetical protein